MRWLTAIIAFTLTGYAAGQLAAMGRAAAEARNFMRTALFACALSLSLVAPGLAGPLEDGIAAFTWFDLPDSDAVDAMAWYRQAAEKGDADSQAWLGIAYITGRDVPKDFREGAKWLRMAAEQGHARAQTFLGFAYTFAWGVPKNHATAVMWYRRAAEQGEIFAQSQLGWAYATGKGVAEDYRESAKWSRMAAEKGHVKSQARLGVLYTDGKGVPSDYVLAHMWLNLAAAGGNADAAKLRTILESEMTPTQLSEAQRLAREWKPRTLPRSNKQSHPSKKKRPQGRVLPPSAANEAAPGSAHWTRLATLLPARKGKTALKPKEIFRLVSPSVWIVYAAHSVEEFKNDQVKVAQGSAVAISTSRLVTNCHVVSKRRVVLIRQKDRFLNAKLISADPGTDRCVLATGSGQVQSVPGVRALGKLEVGERVFTVGAPRGLENTLGEGIISGLRKLNGVVLIQTTAPISPGSSGGGLFDEFGNLIGITTLYLKESDGLNFAIAASEYWR